MEMSLDEGMFFERWPEMLPVYSALKNALMAAYADMTVKVSKTQISFRSRYVFAMASLPWRRVKGWPRTYLLVSFGLAYQKESPRIAQSVEAYPGRWTHHVLVQDVNEIDNELLSWIEEAYRFSIEK